MQSLSAISIIMSAITDMGYIAIAAAIAVATGIGAGIAMGIQTYKALDAVARQPEASNKIRTILMIGLAFTETTAIYGLFIAIMLVINIL